MLLFLRQRLWILEYTLQQPSLLNHKSTTEEILCKYRKEALLYTVALSSLLLSYFSFVQQLSGHEKEKRKEQLQRNCYYVLAINEHAFLSLFPIKWNRMSLVILKDGINNLLHTIQVINKIQL